MTRTFFNITFNGKKYKAVEVLTYHCAGCAFSGTKCYEKGKNKLNCCAESRTDYKNIIWVEKENA